MQNRKVPSEIQPAFNLQVKSVGLLEAIKSFRTVLAEWQVLGLVVGFLNTSEVPVGTDLKNRPRNLQK